MKITTKWKLDLRPQAVIDKVEAAGRGALKDVIIDMANMIIRESPVKYGHNRRSIVYRVGPSKVSVGRDQSYTGPAEPSFTSFDYATGEDEAAVFSTSGYGGYLELHTKAYFKMALDTYYGTLASRIKARLN